MIDGLLDIYLTFLRIISGPIIAKSREQTKQSCWDPDCRIGEKCRIDTDDDHRTSPVNVGYKFQPLVFVSLIKQPELCSNCRNQLILLLRKKRKYQIMMKALQRIMMSQSNGRVVDLKWVKHDKIRSERGFWILIWGRGESGSNLQPLYYFPSNVSHNEDKATSHVTWHWSSIGPIQTPDMARKGFELILGWLFTKRHDWRRNVRWKSCSVSEEQDQVEVQDHTRHVLTPHSLQLHSKYSH